MFFVFIELCVYGVFMHFTLCLCCVYESVCIVFGDLCLFVFMVCFCISHNVYIVLTTPCAVVWSSIGLYFGLPFGGEV